jgi:hypothetical protein
VQNWKKSSKGPFGPSGPEEKRIYDKNCALTVDVLKLEFISNQLAYSHFLHRNLLATFMSGFPPNQP